MSKQKIEKMGMPVLIIISVVLRKRMLDAFTKSREGIAKIKVNFQLTKAAK